MAIAGKYPRLEDFWSESDPDALLCCICKSKFDSTALVRTFRLARVTLDDHPAGCSKVIHTPFDESIVLYDRHLQCLHQSGIRYATVSHVWDPSISRIQNLGSLASHYPEDLPLARRMVVEQPYFVYRGLLRSDEIPDPYEMWHDYISVPQWADKLKEQILLAVPQIYGSAHVTTVHFEDVQQQSIDLLYHGQSTEARLRSITDICNAQWFTRVWTAMEYIRSQRVIAMNDTFDVCSDSSDPLFLGRMHEVWLEELAKHEDVHHLEARAGIGKNMVPWNLGALPTMTKGKSSAFGLAFSLPSKRRCQSDYDFMNALLGCVVPTSDRPLQQKDFDFDREYMRVARMCLAVGDYSPLLMTPRLEEYDHEMDTKQGFNDVGVWPLGTGTQPPQISEFHDDFSFEYRDLDEGDPILKLQPIGAISGVYVRQFGTDCMTEFAIEALIVLKATGPDLESFIEALGGRLYNEDADFIKQRLKDTGQWDALGSVLQRRHSKKLEETWPVSGPHGAEWLADVITLSIDNPRGDAEEPKSRIAHGNAHGGTMHVGFAGLNCTLSVFCASCCRTLVFRAGFFELPRCESVKYMVYRIPGLKYRSTAPDGIGLVLQDGRVVGRLAWATPACPCTVTEKVRVKMPVLPLRRPRP